MNSNQTQSTNQIKPHRFHLKTWQWVSVLVVAAVIVGGVFVVWQPNTQFLTILQPTSTGTADIITYQGKKYFRTNETVAREIPIHEKYKIKELKGEEILYSTGQAGTPTEQMFSLKPENIKQVKGQVIYTYTYWEDEKGGIKRSIKEANYCEIPDDCVLLGTYCPFSGSWGTYVNKAEKQRLQKMIEEYNKKDPAPVLCKPSICNNISPVQCIEEKCYVACRDNVSQANCGRAVKKETCNLINGCVWSNQQCQTIAAAIDEQQSAEQQITITTDKTEYAQEGMAEIAVRNNLDRKIWFALGLAEPFTTIRLEKLENGEWKKINISIPAPTPPPILSKWIATYGEYLEANQEVSFIWYQTNEGEKIFKDPGRYRIKFTYYIFDYDEAKSSEEVPYYWNDTNEFQTTIYSNEFTIK